MLTAYPSDQYCCHRVHGNGRGAGCRTHLQYIIHTSSRWLSVPIAYTRCASEAREPPLASRWSTNPGTNHAHPKIASLQRFSSEVSIQDHMLQDCGDIYSNHDHQDCQNDHRQVRTDTHSGCQQDHDRHDNERCQHNHHRINDDRLHPDSHRDKRDHNRHVSPPHISLPPLPHHPPKPHLTPQQNNHNDNPPTHPHINQLRRLHHRRQRGIARLQRAPPPADQQRRRHAIRLLHQRRVLLLRRLLPEPELLWCELRRAVRRHQLRARDRELVSRCAGGVCGRLYGYESVWMVGGGAVDV